MATPYTLLPSHLEIMYAKGVLSAGEVEEMSRNACERFQAIIDKGTPAHLIEGELLCGVVASVAHLTLPLISVAI